VSPAGDTPVDVCLTNPFAWPEVKRGSETLIRSLSSWLRRAGKHVEIAAGGTAAAAYDLDEVPVTLVRARPLRRLHRDLDEEVTIIPGLSRHLRARKPRVVHSFHYADATAARLARRPYVVSYGGIVTRRSTRGHPLKRALFRFATDGARAVVCPSAAAARHLHETFGYRARVIPNGFGIDDFPLGPPDRRPTILCAATPDDARKRVPVLVQAFAVVHEHRPDAELVLAGRASASTEAALRELVPPAVRGRIRFAGDVTTGELCGLYQQAAVSCLPSLNEAFGLVLVESLACGTPVVAARSGAAPEIVDGEVGALFAPDDVGACAEALLDVLERSSGGRLRAACRARAERYDWGVVGPQLLDLYDEVA
jgi:phosphatidyl-myo-inositol alpha-mannosyltransferase